VSCIIRRCFDVQEYLSYKYSVLTIQDHVVRKTHTWNFHAVTCTKAKLTCMQLVRLVYMPVDYSEGSFEQFACRGQEAYRAQILRKFRSLTRSW